MLINKKEVSVEELVSEIKPRENMYKKYNDIYITENDKMILDNYEGVDRDFLVEELDRVIDNVYYKDELNLSISNTYTKNNFKRVTGLNKYDNYALSVSMTTRSPREGEVDCKDYFFISKEEFEPKASNACAWCDYKSQCPEGQKAAISMAKLRLYLDCPKKYSFKYLEKVQTKSETKPALLFYNYITTMLYNIYKEQKILRKEVKKCTRRFTLCSASNMSGVIFYTLTEPSLIKHIHIVSCTLLKAVCFNKFTFITKLSYFKN